MNKLTLFFGIFLALTASQIAFAQTEPLYPNVKSSPTPTPAPTPKLSSVLSKNLENLQSSDVTRERREQAYAKMLEGQRYVWNLSRRTPGSAAVGVRLARQAFQKAVELDPTLAEGYTALAELALAAPGDIEEAILLAGIAAKINPDNYGAHRILARLYTIKSRLNSPSLEENFAAKAIGEWREIARLDSRNPEAWAFLSEFYERTGKTEQQLAALENWQAAAAPSEVRFYRSMMGAQADLSSDGASLKYSSALIKNGRSQEAVETLSRIIADAPDNGEAIDLLRQALDTTDEKTSAKSLESLQQAVYANPSNLILVGLLAQTQSRAGKSADAVKTLGDAIEKTTDPVAAAQLQEMLGDLDSERELTNEAVAAYVAALKKRGIGTALLESEDDREVATRLYGKIISEYKNANRYAEAQRVIEGTRLLFDKDDLFADQELIELSLESGKKQEALQLIRAARQRSPRDEGLIRTEASVLTDLGKVDEGVALIKSQLKGNTSSAPTVLADDFSNLLFDSGLYSRAKRGKDAIDAANQALVVAQTAERKQIALLSLASAQEAAGDFVSAEATLRDILKQMPNNPIALNNLGYFLIERNLKTAEALKMIQQAVGIDPTNPSYLDSLGWAFYKANDFVKAEMYLKDAARRSQNSATIYEHLGDVYAKQKKVELAKNSYQKALNFSSGAADVSRLKTKLAIIR